MSTQHTVEIRTNGGQLTDRNMQTIEDVLRGTYQENTAMSSFEMVLRDCQSKADLIRWAANTKAFSTEDEAKEAYKLAEKLRGDVVGQYADVDEQRMIAFALWYFLVKFREVERQTAVWNRYGRKRKPEKQIAMFA